MNESIDDIIDKYLEGKCSIEELRMLDDWYEKLDNSKTKVFPEIIVKEPNQYLLNKWISFESSLYNEKELKNTNKSLIIHFSKWVAAAVLLVFVSIFILSKNKKEDNKLFYISSQNGKIRKIILSDSSIVWLKDRALLN